MNGRRIPIRLRLPVIVLLFGLAAAGLILGRGSDAIIAFENPHEAARIEELASRARTGDPDLVFIGDSITAQFEQQGSGVWARHYGSRRAMNLGVGWEQTGNVLWRIRQGHLDPLHPRVIVLHIGTNDSQHGGHDPGRIAAGVEQILSELRQRMPETRVLLLGILPRGRTPDDPFRANNEAANRLLATLADGETVVFRDVGESFLRPDGSLDPAYFAPDALHLSEAGYERWATAIEPDLARLLEASETPATP